jgi:hypothetical protein
VCGMYVCGVGGGAARAFTLHVVRHPPEPAGISPDGAAGRRPGTPLLDPRS